MGKKWVVRLRDKPWWMECFFGLWFNNVQYTLDGLKSRNVRPGKMMFGDAWQDANWRYPCRYLCRYLSDTHFFSSRRPLRNPFLCSSCFPFSFLFHSFSCLFLCLPFLFLSWSFPFTDLFLYLQKPYVVIGPPKSDRYPLLGSKAKTLSLDNGSHIHTVVLFCLQTKWFMDLINGNYHCIYNERDMLVIIWRWVQLSKNG